MPTYELGDNTTPGNIPFADVGLPSSVSIPEIANRWKRLPFSPDRELCLPEHLAEKFQVRGYPGTKTSGPGIIIRVKTGDLTDWYSCYLLEKLREHLSNHGHISQETGNLLVDLGNLGVCPSALGQFRALSNNAKLDGVLTHYCVVSKAVENFIHFVHLNTHLLPVPNGTYGMSLEEALDQIDRNAHIVPMNQIFDTQNLPSPPP